MFPNIFGIFMRNLRSAHAVSENPFKFRPRQLRNFRAFVFHADSFRRQVGHIMSEVSISRRILLTGLFTILSVSAFSQTLPFDPYRKVEGRYYDLRPLYSWLDETAAKMKNGQYRYNQGLIDADRSKRPLPEWIGAPGLGTINRYEVVQIVEDGILLQQVFQNDSPLIFLKHYPGEKSLVDGNVISFLAMRCGSYQYVDTAGATRTIRAYDYGIPYDPWALQAARRAQTNSATTNAPTK